MNGVPSCSGSGRRTRAINKLNYPSSMMMIMMMVGVGRQRKEKHIKHPGSANRKTFVPALAVHCDVGALCVRKSGRSREKDGSRW